MTGAHDRRILRPWKLSKRQQPANLLLLNPQHVYFYVTHLDEPNALDDAHRRVGIHSYAHSGVFLTEPWQQSCDSETSRQNTDDS